MQANLVAVGAYLRRLREAQQRSITEVAAQLGTGEGQIRRIEKGSVDTRASAMVQLCQLLAGNIGDIAYLMLSESATPAYARRLAEQWIAQRAMDDTHPPHTI